MSVTAAPAIPRDVTVGLIGGSGLYEFFGGAGVEYDVETPYGSPSGPVTVGDVGGRRVAFIPRHGARHTIPPHRINYRANIWALESVGVQRLLSPCAVGSLRADLGRGALVICDQIVDRTWGREGTFFDGPEVAHLSAAEPFCEELRRHAAHGGRAAGMATQDTGTVVVIPGPRFNTRAESRYLSAQGWDVVNMTTAPEIPLARELGICTATLAVVTDWDAGTEGDAQGAEAVTQEAVMAAFATSLGLLRTALMSTIARLPEVRECGCARLQSMASAHSA